MDIFMMLAERLGVAPLGPHNTDIRITSICTSDGTCWNVDEVAKAALEMLDENAQRQPSLRLTTIVEIPESGESIKIEHQH